ncbi:sigma-54 dependent transcriptional regulator [Idiomarina sp. HP20-50]|uniref:sigma-54-dependent transcriptional regulator n=1 Tax=Idiomarina sp. HP20-50 TaxID=3070813 RepID=UPI00294B2A5B|nr:sigma-54 dependent transcriptional regulator [Idiomarina sp. HP20-50]MDV6316450.1 sigma-54 dependent transcriptional regulator [Idiomarina sp. HP20-50]
MIAIIDDNRDILTSLNYLLTDIVQQIDTYTTAHELTSAMRNKRYELIILDMNLSQGAVNGREGINLIESIRRLDAHVPIVSITAFADIDIAVEAMRLGANEFIMKPWDNAQLKRRIAELLHNKTTTTSAQIDAVQRFIGESSAAARLRELLNLAARSDANVLVIGETGTGKEIVAQTIHDLSARKKHNFVAVDSGALSTELFESEMFGHEKGAFTGAYKRRKGAFLQANQGTLFLDELGNLPLKLQKKLLRVLEQRQISPIGADQTNPVDVRVITATNANLNQSIQIGEFRQDLYYRLNTIEIYIPPLRQRRSDIICLAEHFIKQLAHQYRQNPTTLSARDKNTLKNYDWPGNARELRNVIERYLIHSQNEITSIEAVMPYPATVTNESEKRHSDLTNSLNLKQLEQQAIQCAISEYHGNISAAAEALGLSRGALYRRLEKYQNEQ